MRCRVPTCISDQPHIEETYGRRVSPAPENNIKKEEKEKEEEKKKEMGWSKRQDGPYSRLQCRWDILQEPSHRSSGRPLRLHKKT